MLCFKKENEVDVTNSTCNISERELSGLQCLGGYVMQNWYKKFKHSKKYNSEEHQEYQQAMVIVLGGKTLNYDSIKNLKPVSVLNLDGLSYNIEDK